MWLKLYEITISSGQTYQQTRAQSLDLYVLEYLYLIVL